MLRVSLRTNRSCELILLKPRELTDQALAVWFATKIPGTKRSASGMVVAPERRISSSLTIATAAAAPRRFSRDLDTEVTSTSISCSMLRCFSAAGVPATSCAIAWLTPAQHASPTMAHAEHEPGPSPVRDMQPPFRHCFNEANMSAREYVLCGYNSQA